MGSCQEALIHGFPNGTTWHIMYVISTEKRTQGSETSQYLKEKKSTEIPSVAASESGLGHLVIIFKIVEVVGMQRHRE